MQLLGWIVVVFSMIFIAKGIFHILFPQATRKLVDSDLKIRVWGGIVLIFALLIFCLAVVLG